MNSRLDFAEKVPLEVVECPSGRYVSIENPDPSTITIEDVAHKLAQVNRWGGSARWPYSVAQHAVFVSERLERQGYGRRIQLLGLHHDDPEAFLGDVPRPWKKLLGKTYKTLDGRMHAAIYEALGIKPPTDEERAIVKKADMFALFVEAHHLMPSQGRSWDYREEFIASGGPRRIVTPAYWMAQIDWDDARYEYLWRHKELTG